MFNVDITKLSNLLVFHRRNQEAAQAKSEIWIERDLTANHVISSICSMS